MTQPPGFGQPGPYAAPPGTPLGPPPPQRRRGGPWWIWLLAGCGGCMVIALGGVLALTYWGAREFTSSPPVTAAAARQQLGSDVPWYPKGTFDPTISRIAGTTARIIGGFAGKGFIRGMAGMITADSPQKVLQFYDKKLQALGWTRGPGSDTGLQQQHQYEKDGEMLMVQTQSSGRGTTIMLMRMKMPGSSRGSRPAGRGSPGDRE